MEKQDHFSFCCPLGSLGMVQRGQCCFSYSRAYSWSYWWGIWYLGKRRGEKTHYEPSYDIGNFISFTFKKPNKCFSVVCKLYDWATYFDSVLTEIFGHTDARWFQFFKNAFNEVVMVYNSLLKKKTEVSSHTEFLQNSEKKIKRMWRFLKQKLWVCKAALDSL